MSQPDRNDAATTANQAAAAALFSAWRLFADEADFARGVELWREVARVELAQDEAAANWLLDLGELMLAKRELFALSRPLSEAAALPPLLDAWRLALLARLALLREDAASALKSVKAALAPQRQLVPLVRAELGVIAGGAQRALRNDAKARDAFREALALNALPFPGEARLGLGDSLCALGMREEARIAYKQAAQAEEEPFYAALARVRLYGLQAQNPLASSDELPILAPRGQLAGFERIFRALREGGFLLEARADEARAAIDGEIRDAELTHRLGVLATRYPAPLIAELKREEKARVPFSPRPLSDLVLRRRAYVSILDTTLHGFVAHFRHLDPEEQFRFLNDYLARIRRLIHRHNGAIASISGPRVTAFFGALDPPEDEAANRASARDALRASLALRADTVALFRRLKSRFFELPVEKIRLEKGGYDLRERTLGLGMGLASGWSQAGALPLGDANGRLLIGHAVNIASRLMRVARPREILVAHSTFELLDQPNRPLCRFAERSGLVEYDGALSRGLLKDYENVSFYDVLPLIERDEG